MNPSERHIQSKGVRLNSEDLRGSHTQPWGGNLLPSLSWLPRLEASHMICFSHQRERDCPRPLACFSHDLDLWVSLSIFLVDSKRFYILVFLGWPYTILKATGNTKYLPVPLGIPLLLVMIPRLVWRIMSHLVRLASSVKTPSSALPKQKND